MPIQLVAEDELFEYVAGETVFLYQRVPYSERQAFQELFQERGVFNQQGFDQALIACGLKGWRHLQDRGVDVPFPAGPLPEQRKAVLEIVRRVPLQNAVALLTKIQDPSPEHVVGESSGLLSVPSSSATPPPVSSIAVPSADENVPSLASL